MLTYETSGAVGGLASREGFVVGDLVIGDLVLGDLHDRGPAPAPPAHDLFDLVGEHLDVVDVEFAPDAVVVKGAGAPGPRHVETGEVATRRTAESGHLVHPTDRSPDPGFTGTPRRSPRGP